MSIEPRLDIIGAALADPSRARILCELMDGRSFTNKELASAARVTPQTATAHLQHLSGAGLTTFERSGRHIYHRIANEQVASALEALAQLSPTDHLTRNPKTSADTMLARSCYNHLAGRLGVHISTRLIDLDVLTLEGVSLGQGTRYTKFLADTGITSPKLSAAQAPAKLCLDWTERRHHLSGPLATAFLTHALDVGWLERRRGSRALTITTAGYLGFERFLGLERHRIDA